MDKKIEKPIRPTEPPIRRIVNEKVINKKEIYEWDKTRKQK